MKKLLFCAILFIGIASAANGQRHNFDPRLNMKPAKMFVMMDLGYGIGVGGNGSETGNYNENRVGLTSIFGYQFSPYFTAGFASSINFYNTSYYSGITTSPMLYLHINLSEGNVSPFISFRGGYTIGQDQSKRLWEGWTFEPTLGLSFRIAEREFEDKSSRRTIGRKAEYRISTSISYAIDEVQYTTSYGQHHRGFSGTLNFRVGLLMRGVWKYRINH